MKPILICYLFLSLFLLLLPSPASLPMEHGSTCSPVITPLPASWSSSLCPQLHLMAQGGDPPPPAGWAHGRSTPDGDNIPFVNALVCIPSWPSRIKEESLGRVFLSDKKRHTRELLFVAITSSICDTYSCT